MTKPPQSATAGKTPATVVLFIRGERSTGTGVQTQAELGEHGKRWSRGSYDVKLIHVAGRDEANRNIIPSQRVCVDSNGQIDGAVELAIVQRTFPQPQPGEITVAELPKLINPEFQSSTTNGHEFQKSLAPGA